MARPGRALQATHEFELFFGNGKTLEGLKQENFGIQKFTLTPVLKMDQNGASLEAGRPLKSSDRTFYFN